MLRGNLDVTQHRAEQARTRRALVLVLRKARADHRLERRREPHRHHGCERRDFVVDVAMQELRFVHVAREHFPAGEQPPRDAPERVEVRAPVEVHAQDLFGRHEAGRAEHRAQLGQLRRLDDRLRGTNGRRDRPGHGGLVEHLDDTEIEQLADIDFIGGATREQVRRLDVAVKQVGIVRFGERGTRLREQLDHARRGQRAKPHDE